MEQWEFLLQKEGDRSWLPLDSPDVEILEGRYRIVARSSRPNTKVEIRISHLATHEIPPKRRVQKRMGQTNRTGLMVVTPFTQLQAGTWEIVCSSDDLMSDLLGTSWKQSVRLQVLAQQSEEDWEPEWTPGTDESESTITLPQLEVGAATQDVAPLKDRAEMYSEVAEVINASLDISTVMNPEVAEILGASMEQLLQMTEQMSTQLVDEVLQQFDLFIELEVPTQAEASSPVTVSPSEEIPPRPVVEESIAPTSEAITPLNPAWLLNPADLSLQLDQAAFIARRAETLTLSGQITFTTVPSVASNGAEIRGNSAVHNLVLAEIDPWETVATVSELTAAIPQELQLCLRDPQTLDILVSDRQPFPPNSTSPLAFSFTCTLPADLTTHLVLGEVLLYGTSPTGRGGSIVLTTQAFTITIDPQELVEELTKLNELMAEELEEPVTIELPSLQMPETQTVLAAEIDLPTVQQPEVTEEPAPLSLNLSFLKLDGELAERSPSLPPKIHHSNIRQTPNKRIELPSFANSEVSGQSGTDQVNSAPVIAEEASSIIEVPSESLSLPLTAPEALVHTEPDSDFPTSEVEPSYQAGSIEAQSLPTGLVWTPTTAQAEQAQDKSLIEALSPVQIAFQSLRLQDRFLNRLKSLAEDAELSVLLSPNQTNSQPALASDAVEEQTAPEPKLELPTPASEPELSLSLEPEFLADEVVVDDEPIAAQGRLNFDRRQIVAHHANTAQDNLMLLPEDHPVPMPILEVKQRELLAGKTVNVQVRLPNLLPKIYVKLWVIDCETRVLLDGPRWLVDFISTGFGELEAAVQLAVPYGSLGIRLEAIAVEMHSQRESHKVTVERRVIPADLPVLTFEDFMR